MYRSDLLGNLDIRAPEFDEWVLTLRVRARDAAMRSGLDDLSEAAGEKPTDEAIAVARKLLEIDPSAKPAHQFLIRLLAMAGQHGEARRQLQECLRILREKFGSDPPPETERLIRAGTSVPRSLAEVSRELVEESNGIPFIVVLPVEEMPNDDEMERIGAGMIDDITMELTRYRSLFVISHDSANIFRTGREEVSELCARLGVRHALCGGMRRIVAGYRIKGLSPWLR